MPKQQTGSATVLAARLNLLDVHATLRSGKWLNQAGENLPVTVLGDQAAQRLGVTAPGERVWLGGEPYAVTGILAPNDLVL